MVGRYDGEDVHEALAIGAAASEARARVEDEGARLDLARVVLAELHAGGEVGEAGGRAGARLVHRRDVRCAANELSQFWSDGEGLQVLLARELTSDFIQEYTCPAAAEMWPFDPPPPADEPDAWRGRRYAIYDAAAARRTH